jgi:ABC-type transporter Mla MlaB component
MAFQINHNNNMLIILGQLTIQNTKSLKRHLRSFSNERDFLMLNIEKVTHIDRSSAYTLEQMYLNAVSNNKVLAVIGMGNKHIAPVMQSTKTAYILSHDRT